MALTDSQHWRKLSTGEFIFEKRKRLGILAQLVPEHTNGDGKEYYTVWIRGAVTQIVLTEQSNPVMYPLKVAARKAEEVVFHPMYLARAHGIKHAFEECPRCHEIQKVHIDIGNNVLKCSVCKLEFQPSQI